MYKCDRVEGDEKYIGESARTFGERFKDHPKAPSPIYEYSNITSHHTSLDNFGIVGMESQNLSKTIKEGIFIGVSDPSQNSNTGKYQLPHIYDVVLFNTPEHKWKWNNHLVFPCAFHPLEGGHGPCADPGWA